MTPQSLCKMNLPIYCKENKTSHYAYRGGLMFRTFTSKATTPATSAPRPAVSCVFRLSFSTVP